jgi:serine/threonine protein kinase
MQLTPGTQVNATLRLVRLLGAGGMGRVWLAEDGPDRRRVAVKFVAEHILLRTPEVAQRLMREARATARIHDAHVVQMLGDGTTDDGVPYIVMELLHGETLAQRVARSPLSPFEACTVVHQVAGVLTKAADFGIVHRDIKPENLFLLNRSGAPFVKVLDFGLAKLVDPNTTAITATGDSFGTPAFMSPEQLLSTMDADASADRWALAVTIYNLLTQRLPFEGTTPMGMALAICSGQFCPPSTHRGDLPAAVDAWFSRALARDRARRFTSAQELSATFVEAARSELDEVVHRRPSCRNRCLEDESVVALAQGNLEPAAVAAADRHLDQCSQCLQLLHAVMSPATSTYSSVRLGDEEHDFTLPTDMLAPPWEEGPSGQLARSGMRGEHPR